MSYDKYLRRLAGVLVAIALLVLPVTAAAAPAGDAPSNWATSLQSLLDSLQSWFVFDQPADDAAPVASVRDASDADLGSTLDPDGQQMGPTDSSNSPIDPDLGLGSTLDPDG